MKDEQYAIHHTAISVSNLDESLGFYENLGFVKTDHYISDDKSLHIVQLNLKDVGLEIFWYPKNAAKSKPVFEYANNLEDVGVKHIGIRVSDINEALSVLQQKGYANKDTEIHSARSLKDSRYLFIQDPDGMWIEFMEDNRGRENS